MKPNTAVNTTEGTLGGQIVAMQIDSNSIAHIMSVLTNLYSDPALAVVREYSVNARDSHIEAGQTKPIEITTPTPLSKYFKVRDYGVGLSPDELTQMYSMYGASTKRGTNAQSGMLGLGSKSALAYTNQFTLISVKNGVKSIVSIRLTEDGTAAMEVVDTSATTEPNGVEITVPARDLNDFTDHCKNFFRFWEPGTVLVDGVEPVSALADATKITDNLWIRRNERYSNERDIVVMGSVPYPTNAKYNHNFSFIAFTEIGTLNFTPSREELHYTELTNTTLRNIRQTLTEEIAKVGKERIEGAASGWEAVDAYRAFKQEYGVDVPAIYKGTDFSKLTWLEKVGGKHVRYDTSRSRNCVTNQRYMGAPIQYGPRTLFVTNYTYQVLSSDRKAKMRTYASQNGLSVDYINIFEGSLPAAGWINPAQVVDWAVVSKVDLGKTYAGRSTSQPLYTVASGNGWNDLAAVPTDKPIYYFSPQDVGRDAAYNIGRQLKDAYFVSIGYNRHDKFKRDYPTAKPLNDYFVAQRTAVEKALTDKDAEIFSMDSLAKNLVKQLTPVADKIKDEDILHLLTLPPSSDTLTAWMKFADEQYSILGRRPNFPKNAPKHSREVVETLRKRYPLLNDLFAYSYHSMNDRSRKHAVAYMNTILEMETTP